MIKLYLAIRTSYKVWVLFSLTS